MSVHDKKTSMENKKLCSHKLSSLNTIAIGEQAVITSLKATGDMRRRLLDIGFIPGTTVHCLGKSPLGDPSAFFIRGAVIALRQKDCADILIEDIHPSSQIQPGNTTSKEGSSWV